MEILSRPAVRIICLDASARVLLLNWQDPSDGHVLWEPPGGAIEAGESPLEAARRELVEETGLDPDAIVDQPVIVSRDVVWEGRRYVGPEPFFLAHYEGDEPTLQPAQLGEQEQRDLRGHAWLSPVDLGPLAALLEPPQLASVIAELCPDGPWRSQV